MYYAHKTQAVAQPKHAPWSFKSGSGHLWAHHLSPAPVPTCPIQTGKIQQTMQAQYILTYPLIPFLFMYKSEDNTMPLMEIFLTMGEWDMHVLHLCNGGHSVDPQETLALICTCYALVSGGTHASRWGYPGGMRWSTSWHTMTLLGGLILLKFWGILNNLNDQ